MASKSSSVHSIRIPNEMWEWLTDEAKARGVTPNGLVCDLLLVGRLRADEAKLAPKPPMGGSSVKPSPAKRVVVETAPEVSAGFRGLTASGEPLPERKPGSMLKAPKR